MTGQKDLQNKRSIGRDETGESTIRYQIHLSRAEGDSIPRAIGVITTMVSIHLHQ